MILEVLEVLEADILLAASGSEDWRDHDYGSWVRTFCDKVWSTFPLLVKHKKGEVVTLFCARTARSHHATDIILTAPGSDHVNKHARQSLRRDLFTSCVR